MVAKRPIGDPVKLRRRIMELVEYDAETGLFHWKTGWRSKRVGWFAPVKIKSGMRWIGFDEVQYRADSVAILIVTGKWPEKLIYLKDEKEGLKLSNMFYLMDPPVETDSPSVIREKIMEVLEYNRDTGLFRWKIAFHGKGKKGWFAGSIHRTGYLNFQIRGYSVSCHRLAWLMETGDWPSQHIDHEDGIRSNNVFSNLRDVPRSENAKNLKFYENNTSGHMGVHFKKKSKTWAAYISAHGKRIGLGSYSTFEEAVCARKEAEVKYGFHASHGKNIPQQVQ